MRSAIEVIGGCRYRERIAATTPAVPQAQNRTGVSAAGWLSLPAAVVRQQRDGWHLRQRLASHGLDAPMVRRWSSQVLGEIGEALDHLGLMAGDRNGVRCWPSLFAPCISGERNGVDAIATLIRCGIVKPNQYGPDGETLLQAIVCRGIAFAFVPGAGRALAQHVTVEERVKLLVALGADPDQPNVFGDIPLQLAWERASELGNRAAGVLLEAGCNPMKRDRTGLTLLHRAARCNKLTVLRAWRDAGLYASPTGGLRDGQPLLQTPLMFAVMAGHGDSVDVLIDQERRLIARGEERISEGYRLMQEGRQQCDGAAGRIAAGEQRIAQGRDLLVSGRAALNIADCYGATALHWAVDYDRPALADVLVAGGADGCARAGRKYAFTWTRAQLAAARTQLQPGRPILPWLLKYGVHPDRPLQALDQAGWRRVRERHFRR